MTGHDLYQVLGVPRSASTDEIRHAFARLAKLHHPDLARDGRHAMPERLQKLQHAYHCLSDTSCRAAHDRALEEDERRHFARQRSVRRHLRRYDRRHSQHLRARARPLRWPWLLVLATGTALAVALALRAAG